ncbi:MAG: 5'/3'-nucleotidase SurE [Bacteroidota bacterium]
MDRPRILVTNDDGMFAPGIKALVEVAREIGEVVVVAPNSPQSGQGHAITLTQPIRLNKVDVFDGIEAYECSGTPVDCVKLAKSVVLKDRPVDLCVSGINHGSNASINIIYSGTMSAAMEASLEGIKSIGFSYLDFSFEADFSGAKHYADLLIRYALGHSFGETNLLNVNIPKLPVEDIKGFRVCRQADGNWTEEFIESKDPRGEKYYWMTGVFLLDDQSEDTDIWALNNGYVSVVPSMHDLTSYKSIGKLKGLESAS